ncbi:rRNA maturation RNase YbeY [Anaerotardibacter muris]|uniref:rRNA maturation RNase YbeY n=1 Tax=Anaerotardibacter muris TaxID=2941505 RepID=UPI002040F9EE|nr:rRNA maturation RNase YbeY [Anaerotardibacter muris]
MDIALRIDHGKQQLNALPLKALAQYVLTELNYPQNTSVSITFVDNDRIHELNRDYRGMDKPTDVLSFECDNVPFEDESLEEVAEYELGDVIIATDVAVAQTEEFGTSLEEEVSLLLTHGLLHLCGYDHIEDAEAEEMEALEDQLLKAWFGGIRPASDAMQTEKDA